MFELKDTTELMCSKDYKDRFIAEMLQLEIRVDKLEKFINRIIAARMTGSEEPKHDCPLTLLEDQLAAMKGYLKILKLRAVIEKIEER